MLKKIFQIIFLLLVILYLIIAITKFNNKPDNQTCNGMELIIKDSNNKDFISRGEIVTILKHKNLYPVGKKMKDINTRTIEKTLIAHPLIENTECYKTPSGRIHIELYQRIPILHVYNNNGSNYYIDNKGAIIPERSGCIANCVIATGNITKSFLAKDLYKFGVFLQNNKFWNAQVEQINVLPDNNIELVPRVGDHLIYLGKIDDYENKLERLKAFYEKALSKVGWNKYSRINVEFDNQIICSKRDSDNVTLNKKVSN
ncbi:MAG: cell division protein FtsQ [Bacteroidaceae bacterium]|nr:cell division protein FtsQ [Bacteroidaceae bacterium]